jgi:hypothetical protein
MKKFLTRWIKRLSSAKLTYSIQSIRNSVCAILKIHKDNQQNFQISVVGTGWCVVPKRFIVTAFHIFNNGQPRDPNDKFFVLFVPDNGPSAWHTPIINFLLEESTVDMAILEIDSNPLQSLQIPAIPITFKGIPDGERVITCGFPAPAIVNARVDNNGNWLGGTLFLKSHANEGIVSGQFEINGIKIYELNIGWHHGESGGPIIRIEPLSAIAVMQRYRNIQTPHGIVAGPHQGNAIKSIEDNLRRLDIKIV